MTFLNFSYQYPPEAKVYLEPSRTSAMELFREIFFSKFHKNTPLLESLFNKVTGFLYRNFRKRKDSNTGVFWHFSYWKPPGDCFCSTKKYFTNKKVQNSLRKEKMETACKKNKDTQNKNLITIYIKSSYRFIIKKFLYFSFLCFLWYIESATWNNAIPLRNCLL